MAELLRSRSHLHYRSPIRRSAGRDHAHSPGPNRCGGATPFTQMARPGLSAVPGRPSGNVTRGNNCVMSTVAVLIGRLARSERERECFFIIIFFHDETRPSIAVVITNERTPALSA